MHGLYVIVGVIASVHQLLAVLALRARLENQMPACRLIVNPSQQTKGPSL